MTREDELLKLWKIVEEEFENASISVEAFGLALREYLQPQSLLETDITAMIHFLDKKLGRGYNNMLLHHTEVEEIIDLLKEIRVSG